MKKAPRYLNGGLHNYARTHMHIFGGGVLTQLESL